jgi:TPR repeat protein
MTYVPCAPSSVKSWKCGFARSDCDPQNKADSLGLRWRAGAGIADAQYRVGMLLKSGKTDEPNGPELGVSWLRQAADQGYPQAKEALPK